MPDKISDPDVVFHYTSVAALWSIIRSRSIWATNIRYLNDISESTHCIETLQHRADNYLTRNPTEFGEVLLSALDRTADCDPPYVASFSRAEDSLPLWRSYCPSGNGVSIGFRLSSLKKSVLIHNPPNENTQWYSVIQPVEYLDLNDFQRQDTILRECLSSLKGHLASKQSAPKNVWFRPDDVFLMHEIAHRACMVKHAGFQSENEVRLIAPQLLLNGAMLKFRFSRTTAIPYVEVLMPLESEGDGSHFIDHVVVGPTPNPDLTIEAVKMMFEGQGGDAMNVPVLQSGIPYRDL